MKITFVRTPFTLLSLSAGWMMATLLPTSRAEADDAVVVQNHRNLRKLDFSPDLTFPTNPPTPYPAVTCTSEDENAKTCKEEGEEVRKKYDKSLEQLEDAYNDAKCHKELYGKNVDETEEDYKKCKGIESGICGLRDSLELAVNKTEAGCLEREAAKKRNEESKANIAVAMANFNRRRALVPVGVADPDLEVACNAALYTMKSTKESITTTNKDLGIAIEVISGVSDNLGLIKDSVDSTIFGVAAGTVIGVVIAVLTAAINALNIVILELTDTLDQAGFRDEELEGTCSGVKEAYMRAYAEDTNKIVGENQVYLEFLSCRFENNTAVFVGAGCDGLDNDCDSDVLGGIIHVDECDEDLVPPTLELSKDPPATFFSQQEATAWFMEHTVVSDDCVPQARLLKTLVDSSVEGQVTIRVDDTRCSENFENLVPVRGRALLDGPGEPSTTRTFFFVVDGEAPTVTCGFGAGGDPLFIDRFEVNRELVDVQFWFNIVEKPAPSTPEDVQVSITVTSNEYEASSTREMLRVFEQQNLGGPNRPAIRFNALLAPYTCGDFGAESPCLSEGGGADAARFYDITVVATDSSGNAGEATCTVVAVPEYDPNPNPNPNSGKKQRPSNEALLGQLASSSQRFKLEKIQFVYNTSEDAGSGSSASTLPPARNGNNGSLKFP